MAKTVEALAQWLAKAPALADMRLRVSDAGPAPGEAGLFPGGVERTARRENLLGETLLRCRAGYILRLVLPLPSGDSLTAAENMARVEALQEWVNRRAAARDLPPFGNADIHLERLSATEGRLERVDAEGCAVYRLKLVAEYTEKS